MLRWPLFADHFSCDNPEMVLTTLDKESWRVDTSPKGGKIEQTGTSGKVGRGDWTRAKFLTVDVLHRCPDILVIVVTFAVGHRAHLNDEIEVHFGVLPNVPTRLCIPLEALNAQTLFLSRYPGTMQTVLRGGTGIRADEVNYLSIGTIQSIESRSFVISNLALTSEEPEFLVNKQPIIDKLGQHTGNSWYNRIPNAKALADDLQHEMEREESSDFYAGRWGRYGGFKGLQFETSGFFRTHHDGRRWWLVDPEGYAFLSTGFDCVSPGEFMKVNGMSHLTTWLPAKHSRFQDAWSYRNGEQHFSYAVANLIRAFGTDWWSKWVHLTIQRHREWGLNTIGNWSQPEFIRAANIPYVWPLAGFPSTRNMIFRDFPDVFDESYQQNADVFARQLESFVDDPLLIGYFLRNEPHFAFVDHLNIAEKMLESPTHFRSKDRLITFLQKKYANSIEEWNRAWNSDFTSFEDLLIPTRDIASRSAQAHADLDEFSGEMIEAYVRIPAEACKRIDPNHLNLGMRYAWISSEHLLRGAQHFDVFSMNTYQMKPDGSVIRQIHDATGLPVMIGEFHHGAADTGMLATGIRGVRTQHDRGLSYRYFVEQGVAMPELVGMHYFQWNDQPLLGRYDGENYQIGAVDVCHQPYRDFISGLKETHLHMYEVASGLRVPYDKEPEQIPKTGF
ncbi:beta-galactosidase [Alicyclobacillus fastidiosus]|uniref:Beta-galactosidase n=1 Tax=Alicyclobacillus fastidiosus TaxID=392011 RepID=A0ABY6ZBD1_9BACL|nr:beta-galactosidase [Alicyclobacillus fastidiosus]WAH40045.1 beta-galactosidase [Alicyclobacillus fastidiosus]GMA61351.1 hypothetical protein GCM10025859_17910 [Alicyclobacillus fastidiosus]